MSIRCEGCGLEYAGGRGLARDLRPAAPLPTRGSCGCSRRSRASTARARRSRCDAAAEDDPTRRRVPARRRLLRLLRRATSPSRWSPACGPPARRPRCSTRRRYLFRFLAHHGMLTVSGSPQWRTVVGGSRTYVERLAARLPDVRRRDPVTAVTRHDDGVDVRDAAGERARASTASSSPPTPTRRSPARRPDPTRRRPRRVPLLAQRDLLHRDASVLPEAARGPGVLELPMALLRPAPTCSGRQLLDEPAAGPRHADKTTSSRSTPPIGSTRPACSRGCSTSTRSTPRRRRGQRRLPGADHRPARLRRRLPRLGLPRGRLPLRRRGRRGLRGGLVSTPADLRRPLPALVVGTVRTRAAARCATPSPTALPVAGRPRRPAPAAVVRCAPSPRFERARPPRATRVAASRPTSSGSWAARGASSATATGWSCWPTPAVLGPRFDPLSVVLVLRGRRPPGLPWSSRCTTPTAGATPTCSPRRRRPASVDKAFYVSPFNDVERRVRRRPRLAPDHVSQRGASTATATAI